MKRILILAGAFLMFAAIATNAYADKGFGVYLGAGGSYAFECMDIDEYNGYYVREFGVSPEVDGTYGFYALAGARLPIPEKFRIARMFSFELEGNYLPGFEGSEESVLPQTKGAKLDVELDVTTITGAIKFDPKIGEIEVFRPYVFMGGGLMIGEITSTASYKGKTISGGNTEHDPCFKAGLGFDYYLTESISLNMEATYVTGFHDLDEVKYVNGSAGFAFHM